MKYDFAVIGGDKRLAYMVPVFMSHGFQVITYGLDVSEICMECRSASSLKDAVASAKNIIGPVPITRDGSNIVGAEVIDDLTMESLLGELTSQHRLFAGCIPESMWECGERKQIFMYDYMENEELMIYNTIATAEGAIAEAISYQPTNLHDSNCLVLGFGKCARTLAVKLQGLSAKMAVCARRPSVLAKVNACGYKGFDFSKLNENIGEYEYIFNSVPSVVLNERALKHMKKDAIIIDIAAAPGGVDFEKAKELGIQAKLCLGLPGIYAPKSSAKALAETTLSQIRR